MFLHLWLFCWVVFHNGRSINGPENWAWRRSLLMAAVADIALTVAEWTIL